LLQLEFTEFNSAGGVGHRDATMIQQRFERGLLQHACLFEEAHLQDCKCCRHQLECQCEVRVVRWSAFHMGDMLEPICFTLIIACTAPLQATYTAGRM
jgi:hypothetical protein